MSFLFGSTQRTADLADRMRKLGVREDDLVETFVRSGGHGGQNVNKVATCVTLLHRPSGIQVKCQTNRQQAMNRLLARDLLLDKLAAIGDQKVAQERAAREKLRRQKRPRSQAAKQRILADKSRRANKKATRRVPIDNRD